MSLSREEIAKSIEELLRIAKVAMPTDLFEIDPRIIKAQALLAQLKGEVQ